MCDIYCPQGIRERRGGEGKEEGRERENVERRSREKGGVRCGKRKELVERRSEKR